MSYKAGFVGMIGIPNAGKSTLVNCLVGEKITIVSKKPQTTRKRITGIMNDPHLQAILVDAPGVISDSGKHSKILNDFIIEEYKDVIKNSDVLLAVMGMDIRSPEPLDKIMDLLNASKKPWAAVLTKSDLGYDHRVNVMSTKLENAGVRYASISAAQNPDKAREEVKKLLAELLPESPAPLYDEELLTTEKTRYLVGEIVREKCFENLYEEIPYDLAVIVRNYEEQPHVVKINVDIMVQRESHKKIVIGQKAQNIKKIGSEARTDIEKLIGKKVYLELFVAIKKNWVRNPIIMEELGYVHEK